MEQRLLKGAGAGLWSVCLTLFIVGLMQHGQGLDYYAFGCLAAFGGCVCSGWLIVAKEAKRNRECMAEAIAVAVANELDEREQQTYLRSV